MTVILAYAWFIMMLAAMAAYYRRGRFWNALGLFFASIVAGLAVYATIYETAMRDACGRVRALERTAPSPATPPFEIMHRRPS